jgi:hypothetical protein
MPGNSYPVRRLVFAAGSFNPEPTATVASTVAVGSGLNEPDRLRWTMNQGSKHGGGRPQFRHGPRSIKEKSVSLTLATIGTP